MLETVGKACEVFKIIGQRDLIGKHFCIEKMFDPFICIKIYELFTKICKTIALYHMTSHLGVK